ncbi:MAG: short chain dehydrogenase [Proteobacteria bacterium]|nr:short chain dehydrogenase [Pseudomonadota bacterium]
MKIIVVGGTGTIGKAVVKELSQRHEIIVAAYQHGDIQVDITDIKSIEKMYDTTGKIDAVIATTGKVHFGEFLQITPEQHQIGLNSKLMGQVNLVSCGINAMNDNGSFTLTSGILSHDPIRYGTSASMVNAAINGFVIGAAIELPRNIRINVVSPSVLAESMHQYGEYFHGFLPVRAANVALAFSKSVEGLQTGQIYDVN